MRIGGKIKIRLCRTEKVVDYKISVKLRFFPDRAGLAKFKGEVRKQLKSMSGETEEGWVWQITSVTGGGRSGKTKNRIGP